MLGFGFFAGFCELASLDSSPRLCPPTRVPLTLVGESSAPKFAFGSLHTSQRVAFGAFKNVHLWHAHCASAGFPAGLPGGVLADLAPAVDAPNILNIDCCAFFLREFAQSKLKAAGRAAANVLAFWSAASCQSVPHSTYSGPLSLSFGRPNILSAQAEISIDESTRSVVPCRRCTRMTAPPHGASSNRVGKTALTSPGVSPVWARSY